MCSLSFWGEKAIPKLLMTNSHHFMRSRFSEKHLAYIIFISESYFMSFPVIELGN